MTTRSKLRSAGKRLARADRGAAEMAFFFALSLVPFVAVSLALASRLLPVDLSTEIEATVESVLPAEARVEATGVLRWARSSASKGWLTAGFVVAWWSAFRFMSLCVRALGAAMAAGAEPPVWEWRQIARSLLLLVVWTLTLVATAAVLLAAPAVESGLLELSRLSRLSPPAFASLRAAASAVLLFGAILLTYRVVAGRRVGWSRVAGPALFAAVGWVAASWGFSRIAPWVWGGAQLAGTLGSIVLFLMWAYAVAWVLLIGAFFVGPVPRRRSR